MSDARDTVPGVDPNATIVAGLITGGCAFIAVMVGNVLNRRAASQAEKWWRREESLRMLRWGSEQAVSDNEATSRMGQAVLDALYDSADLLQAEDRPLFVAVQTAVLTSLVADQARAYHEGDLYVVRDAGTDCVDVDEDQVDDSSQGDHSSQLGDSIQVAFGDQVDFGDQLDDSEDAAAQRAERGMG